MGTATVATATTHANMRQSIKIVGNLDWKSYPMAITLSSSYATGGDTVPLPNILTAAGITIAQVFLTSRSGSYYPVWTYATSAPYLLQMFSAFGTQVSNATNLSAIVVDALFLFYGRGD